MQNVLMNLNKIGLMTSKNILWNGDRQKFGNKSIFFVADCQIFEFRECRVDPRHEVKDKIIMPLN